MIRSNFFRIGFGLLLLTGPASAQEPKIPRPEHPRPDAMRARWANSERSLGVSVRRTGPRAARGLGKARRGGIQPDDRRAVSVGERAVGNSPDPGRAQGRLVPPRFQSPHGVSWRRAGVAPVWCSRLAG